MDPAHSSWLVDRDQVFIGGLWADAHGTETVEIRNPATLAPIARARLGDDKDIDVAVAAARKSFDGGVWSRAEPVDRGRVLRQAADILESWAPQLATAITAELGCPIWFSQRAHVPNPIRHIRYYGELASSFPYDERRTDGTNTSVVTQESVGVVAAITPWNGPLSTPSLKVAPALAAGCSVVLKPSPETPLAVYALGEALARAGLPEGVFSIVAGDRAAGEHLVNHPDVDKIAFTGSTLAGKAIMAAAAARIARVTLELGGKSAAVILDDADLSVVIAALLPMALLVNGQACIAQTRVLVPRAREREIVDALADALRQERVGDPMDATTTIGPLVNERQRARVNGYIDLGRAEGATVVVGNDQPVLPREIAHGWFVPPTLLADVSNDMRVAREEIFGPVLAVIAYDNDEQAIALANDSAYGLSGSVWGTDEQRCLRIARRVRTGMVSINGRPQAYGTPFGGFKQSGLGREMGPEGFRSYLETKSIALST